VNVAVQMFCEVGIDVCTKDLMGPGTGEPRMAGMLLQKANEQNSGAMIYLHEAK
jgi:hypothetical protein